MAQVGIQATVVTGTAAAQPVRPHCTFVLLQTWPPTHTHTCCPLPSPPMPTHPPATAQSRIITSGSGDWRYVDVVAVRAGKLEALEWVRKLYNIPVEVRPCHQHHLGVREYACITGDTAKAPSGCVLPPFVLQQCVCCVCCLAAPLTLPPFVLRFARLPLPPCPDSAAPRRATAATTSSCWTAACPPSSWATPRRSWWTGTTARMMRGASC